VHRAQDEGAEGESGVHDGGRAEGHGGDDGLRDGGCQESLPEVSYAEILQGAGAEAPRAAQEA